MEARSLLAEPGYLQENRVTIHHLDSEYRQARAMLAARSSGVHLFDHGPCDKDIHCVLCKLETTKIKDLNGVCQGAALPVKEW
jgi:hypothetical protein